MQFWKENKRGKKIHSFMLFIPFAFKRYAITSIFIVLAVAMTIVTLFTGPSTIQLLKNSEKKEPVEYQVSLYPPASDKVHENLWIDEVTTLLRQNRFENYSWIYKGRRVIDVLTLFYWKADVRKIKTLLQKKGLLEGDVNIEPRKIAHRLDTYDIEFELDEKASSVKEAWSNEVENLLLEKGYFASADYGQHNPAALNVGYPPFREAYSIIELIKKNGLKSPSAFSLYENNPADDVLLTIRGADNAVLLSGFVPLKKYNPEIHPDSSLFNLEIVNPEGNTSVVKVTAHPFAGFRVRFPQDFTPQNNRLSKGLYQVRCYLNDQKASDTQFVMDNNNTVIWHHNKESQRVFYSRVDPTRIVMLSFNQ
jgi:hypothetical protein